MHLAYGCHERVGFESVLTFLPLEVIELIGKHITIRVALHGLCTWYATAIQFAGIRNLVR